MRVSETDSPSPGNEGMYPLSEYLRPWKLSTFAIGIGWLIWGAFHYQFEDWDVGISLLMGTLAYLLAPWSVWVFIRRRWALMPLALFAAWFTIDGVYVLYNEWFGRWYPREENFYASSCLYLLCGFGWLHKGDLRSLFKPILSGEK